MIRHGSFKGLREDKPAAEVELERATDPAAGVARQGRARRARRKPTVTVEGRELALSNLDKVLYPEAGFTKGQVIDYYARVAEVLLPHLRGRPLTLKRYPNGVEGKFFYEKRCPQHRPDWVQTASDLERPPRGRDRLLPGRRPADPDLARQPRRPRAAHLALARRRDRDPDRARLRPRPRRPRRRPRLRPGRALAARPLRAARPRSYPKTSGSKGIQLYVPLNTEVTYERDQALRESGRRDARRRNSATASSRRWRRRSARQGADRLEPERPPQDDRLRLLAAGSHPAVDPPTRSLPAPAAPSRDGWLGGLLVIAVVGASPAATMTPRNRSRSPTGTPMTSAQYEAIETGEAQAGSTARRRPSGLTGIVLALSRRRAPTSCCYGSSTARDLRPLFDRGDGACRRRQRPRRPPGGNRV